MDSLEVPTSADSLYLARGAEVRPYRPIVQGDVFAGVDIPGVEASPDGLAMIIAHACSMRAGAHLRDHVLMSRVRETAALPLDRWANGYFGQMPLPELTGPTSHHAAFFEHCGRVPSSVLRIDQRIACLDRPGVLHLQQRIAFHHTRVVVGLGRLHEVSAQVLEEVDLLEEWLEEFCPQEPSIEAINREENAFDQAMRVEHDGQSLRNWLGEPSARPMVRRAIREAIGARRRAG